jgi:hypothetical protein
MTREQAALLKKARDSLRGAKLLAGDGLHDFAASRAYYTMFYVVLRRRGATACRRTFVFEAHSCDCGLR